MRGSALEKLLRDIRRSRSTRTARSRSRRAQERVRSATAPRSVRRVLPIPRRRLRNHLRSLHAIALSNLAELTGNIALAYSIPGDARFIVTRMSIEYFSKARGEITATCASSMPADNVEREIEIPIELKDAQSVLVARASLFSLVGPVKDAKASSTGSGQSARRSAGAGAL